MKATASERRWPLETEEASKQPPERNTALHLEDTPRMLPVWTALLDQLWAEGPPQETATASPPSAPAALTRQQPATCRQDPPPAERLQLAESSDDHILSNEVFLNEGMYVFGRHRAIAHLTDYIQYSINIAFTCTGTPKNSLALLY